MSLNDDFVIVLRNISSRRLRSWLTVLGVVIGVASIIALVTVSRGLENSIQEQFEAFGSDKISVLPKSDNNLGLGSGLNEDDVRAVERVSGFDLVAGLLSKSGKITYRDENRNTFLIGWDSDKSAEIFREINLEIVEGVPFESDSNKIVVGPRVANDLFERDLFVGSKVEIEGEKFEISGILESVGNPADDSNIYMPLSVMRRLFDDEASISYIMAKVKAGVEINKAAADTKKELEQIRSKESFDVSTPEQLLAQLGTILGILQGVLVGIAAISLAVGSVGIANSMYTSVLERRRDIGVMKAVGATRNEITIIFLIEAAFLGFVGGIIGVAAGLSIAWLVGFVAIESGFSVLKITIDPALIVFGLAFAVIVGSLSGFFPARQAAMLKPVDALRK